MSTRTRQRINITGMGDVTIVTLAGTRLLEERDTKFIGNIITCLINGLGTKKFLLNFRGVRSVSAATIEMLIRISMKLDASNGVLAFCNVSKQIVGIFSTAQTRPLWRIEKTETEALQAIGA